MSESAKAQYAFRPETSIPEGAVPLELILCTEELHRRPSRPPDYEKEKRALVKLVSALSCLTRPDHCARTRSQATQVGPPGRSRGR